MSMTFNQPELFGQPEDDGLLQQTMQEEQEAQDEPKEDFDTLVQNSDAETVGDFLQEDCMTVEMELGSLPTSFAIPKEVKQKWAETTDTNQRRVRGRLAILSSDSHPYLKEGNALKRQITAILDQYTLPKQQVAVSASGITGDGAKLISKKESGKRIILKSLVDEFTEKITPAIDAYIMWGAGLDQRLDMFRAEDREALGDAWDLMEPKYPKSLAPHVTVVEPTFSPINVSVDFEKVAPRSAEQLRKTNAAWLDATVGAAVDEVVATLLDNVRDVVRQLGTRVRLLPAIGSEYGHLREHEVKKILKHEDDPQKIPADSYLVFTQIKGSGVKEHLIPVSAYKSELNAYETDEHCKLYSSGIDKLMTLAEKIGNIQSMLGDDGPAINSFASQLQDLLVNFGHTPAAITKELKGGFARNTARSQLSGLADSIEGQLVQREKKQKVHRRRIG
tara:strand:+ start:4195 stop:5538 length:1344 start_codon:yes stop_codon:yes gene_type:complete